MKNPKLSIAELFPYIKSKSSAERKRMAFSGLQGNKKKKQKQKMRKIHTESMKAIDRFHRASMLENQKRLRTVLEEKDITKLDILDSDQEALSLFMDGLSFYEIARVLEIKTLSVYSIFKGIVHRNDIMY